MYVGVRACVYNNTSWQIETHAVVGKIIILLYMLYQLKSNTKIISHTHALALSHTHTHTRTHTQGFLGL